MHRIGAGHDQPEYGVPAFVVGHALLVRFAEDDRPFRAEHDLLQGVDEILVVDGVLQGPGATVPTEWRDVRLRTPAGMVALRRMSGGIAVVVFGNAGPELQSAQRAVADAVRATP